MSETLYEKLSAKPTLRQGHTADLKVDGEARVWLARTSLEDGEPFEHTVYIEMELDGAWQDVAVIDGDTIP